jgi:Flp pilus assembly protein TadG
MRLFDIMSRHRRRHRSRGQSLVELALILPVLMLLLAAALDLGRIFYAQITIANAAREGAIEAQQNPTSWISGGDCHKTNNRVMCRVLNEAKDSFVTIAKADVSMSCSASCDRSPGSMATVSVDGHFTLITPLMAVFTGGQSVTFTSTATAQIATPPNGGVATTPSPTPTATPTATPTPTPAPTGTGTAEPTATATASPTPTVTPCFAPSAAFTVSPSSGVRQKTNQVGTVFSFTDSSLNMSDGCDAVWSWNFGDGAGTSSLRSPNYVYQTQKSNPGFTVTLVVTNSMGTSTASVVVPVYN